jgi:hypothetical protein
MLCPHCSTVVRFEWRHTDPLQKDTEANTAFEIYYGTCPNCERLVVFIQRGNLEVHQLYGLQIGEVTWEKMLFPKDSHFESTEDIPKQFLEDYEEALKVLSASPKASAALTRRLLQNILREKYDIVEKSLSQEIQKFVNLPGIPSHLTDAVDAIRLIGNLAAHPSKDKNTGEIVPVESGEAEWLIEVIEALFDFTFIQPIKLERRKAELNLKLERLGKPKMK